ncbi:MAG: ABC transporter ATP-binding protein [Gammaproteobacteria bacterium]|nr:ABC transporter ATP-binding protein [Gammaproteobacteria bacterium]
MPIATFKNVSIAFGKDEILSEADLVVHHGEHLALAGRNGAGKSTTLKLISGELKNDSGEIWTEKSLKFVSLPQQLPIATEESVFTAVSSVFEELGQLISEYQILTQSIKVDKTQNQKLNALQNSIEEMGGWSVTHKVEAILDRLNLPSEKRLSELSGGWLKRVSIAKTLVQEPDIWILDEPTNHLDIEGIIWLESIMAAFKGTILFVSHDRRLMERACTGILEIDRGKLIKHDCGYSEFVHRRDKSLEIEAEHNRQFDEKLRKEEAWIRQGIKARRTRNEGRVRALEALRAERKKRLDIKKLKLAADSGIPSGKIVKEITNLEKSLGGEKIIHGLDLIIQRGDRIGFLGSNGCGKSTLVKLLLNELEPDEGTIKTGTKLQVSYFDQDKAQIDQNQTVFDFLSDGRDFVTIGEREIHIVSYLQNFLFSSEQARAPIRTLSGGEQNRLLLAKLFSLPANLLVLDEPTNDLDIETLELLEDLLIKYKGTVILVSHDRAFLDNVVSSLLVFEGDGKLVEHVGGYSSWRAAAKSTPSEMTNTVNNSSNYVERKKRKSDTQKKKRAIEKITDEIDQAEQQIEILHEQTSKATFFESSREQQAKIYTEIKSLESKLSDLMNNWEELEGKEE